MQNTVLYVVPVLQTESRSVIPFNLFSSFLSFLPLTLHGQVLICTPIMIQEKLCEGFFKTDLGSRLLCISEKGKYLCKWLRLFVSPEDLGDGNFSYKIKSRYNRS